MSFEVIINGHSIEAEDRCTVTIGLDGSISIMLRAAPLLTTTAAPVPVTASPTASPAPPPALLAAPRRGRPPKRKSPTPLPAGAATGSYRDKVLDFLHANGPTTTRALAPRVVGPKQSTAMQNFYRRLLSEMVEAGQLTRTGNGVNPIYAIKSPDITTTATDNHQSGA